MAKLRHVAMVVEDMEKTAKFYEESFGMQRVRQSETSIGLTDGYRLKCRLKGEKIDLGRHELLLDIKAATYHNLKIERVNDKFMAEIVFDI